MDFQIIKNKSIKDRYSQPVCTRTHPLYLSLCLVCTWHTWSHPRQTPAVQLVMDDTVVGDQSRWEEPCRSEALPSAVAQQYNGASVTLWLRLGCSGYSWVLSSTSPLLFIHPAHLLLLTHAKKVSTHLLLASLPLPCLISRQREYIQMFSARVAASGTTNVYLLCFPE